MRLLSFVIIGLSTALVSPLAHAEGAYFYDDTAVYNVSISDEQIAVKFDPAWGGQNGGSAFFASHPCLNGSFSPRYLYRDYYVYIVADSCSYAAASADLLGSPVVLRTAPSFVSPRDSSEFWVTDLVTVQFGRDIGVDSALSLIHGLGLEFVDSSAFLTNLWQCALSDTHSATALDVGNALHLMSGVAWACGSMLGGAADIHAIPDDPYFPNQYYLRNTGQTGGESGIDIGATVAWELAASGSTIKVAVLDDGLVAHPDVPESRLLPGFDVGGVNAEEGYFDFDPQPGDSNGHGMACTGIIAATHNGTGIAGILPISEIIPVKVFDERSDPLITPFEFLMGQAFLFAASQGAQVISCSWGYRGKYDPYPEVSGAIRAVTRANPPLWDDGCVVVFSAGNEADQGTKHQFVKFPGNMPEVITVGAIDKNGDRWYYSNHGRVSAPLDVMAPTGDRGWALPSEKGDVYTVDQEGNYGFNPWITGVYDIGDRDHTGIFGGTSAAAPQVAGIAALLLSRFPGLASDTTNETIRRIINDCAVDLGDPGADTLYGHGRARADFALLTPMHGDLDNNGFFDATDVAFAIDEIHFGATPHIHWSLADWDCNREPNVVDLQLMIDYVFFGQGAPPPLCTWYCSQL